jgi:ATP-dependent protease ClpP protease subunit
MNPTWYAISAPRNSEAEDSGIEISIYDEIGFGGVTAKNFVADLRKLKDQHIHLRINSVGGSVIEGAAIYNALRRHKGGLTVHVDGLAASMASVIAMAGTRIEMPRNAFMMIHNPSGFAVGDSADMRQLADLLDKIKGSLLAAYRERTKKSDEDLTAMMDAETWLTGEEAVEHGFADATSDEVALSASAFKTARITAALRHVPSALFDIAPLPSPSRTPTPMKALLALASLVGITVKGDETEDQLTAAITAHKPQSPNVVIDFEDAAVKAAFAASITEATKDDKAKLTALETELAKITALLTNGAAGAAGGNAPIQGAQGGSGTPANTMTRAAFNQLPHAERNAFMAAKGKLED